MVVVFWPLAVWSGGFIEHQFVDQISIELNKAINFLSQAMALLIMMFFNIKRN